MHSAIFDLFGFNLFTSIHCIDYMGGTKLFWTWIVNFSFFEFTLKSLFASISVSPERESTSGNKNGNNKGECPEDT